MGTTMRTLAAVTTMNQEYYDTIGHVMIDSFVRYWPKDVTLHVFAEDFELPVRADNIRTWDLWQCCGSKLQAFLDWRGQHHTRKFAYKAYAWIQAPKLIDTDVLMYIDSDTQTKQPVPRAWLDQILPDHSVLAYMYARATGLENDQEVYYDNAETCIYFFNRRHAFASEFMRRYEEIYESREIGNSAIYKKSHDTWVMAECVRHAQRHGAGVVNLHPECNRRTPIKATVLYEYFDHYKGKTKFLQKATP
jgi:hypothetical protein